jgi:hypothetical protein
MGDIGIFSVGVLGVLSVGVLGVLSVGVLGVLSVGVLSVSSGGGGDLARWDLGLRLGLGMSRLTHKSASVASKQKGKILISSTHHKCTSKFQNRALTNCVK